MKKIIYVFVLVAVAIIGCKKEAELPELDFKFSVTANQENFSDKGVNEPVKIDFDILSDYNFTKLPLKYKIETTGESSISDGSEKILPNDSYTLTEPKLSLIYTGRNKGEHKIKVIFTNEKKTLEKEFLINYKEYGYKLEVLNGNTNPYQGENVDFDLKIIPENTALTEYFITFKTYDAEDPNLEKSLVALNGEKIVFDKEYKIEDLSNIKIRLNSFYAGTKELKYIVKNDTYQREEKIQQEVQSNTITLESFKFNSNVTDDINQMLNLKGFVTKHPKQTNKIWYKTWVSQATNNQTNAVNNTENVYKEATLPNNNEFSLDVQTSNVGVYVYNIRFKDEFGNESPVEQFTLTVNDKRFTIEQIDGDYSNLFQGQTATMYSKVVPSSAENYETYKIRFLKFDEQDIYLNKSFILFNGKKVSLNTDIEMPIQNNTIEVSSFHSGEKVLMYKVTNSVGKEQIKETTINFKKATILASNWNINNSRDIIVGENFTIEADVNTLSPNGKFFYKTWVEKKSCRVLGMFDCSYRKTKQIPSTEGNYQLQPDDMQKGKLLLNLNATDTGEYKYYIQFKDEFGNESMPQEFYFQVKPPIVIDELILSVESNTSHHYYYYWKFSLKARNINDSAVLTKADVYLPSRDETFIITHKGVNHSLRISASNNHDDFNLMQQREIHRVINCDYDAALWVQWNINTNDNNEIKSIKTALLEKFRTEYKLRVIVNNSKGHQLEKQILFSSVQNIK